MTDIPDKPDSPSPTPNDPSGFSFEEDLDAALARASQLADHLAAEAGSEPDALAGTANRSPTEKHAPDLDAALSELESLIAETERQMSRSAIHDPDMPDNTPAPTHTPRPRAPAESTARADDGEPDFMAEFLDAGSSGGDAAGSSRETPGASASTAQPGAKGPTLKSPAASSATAKPGVIGTGMLGVVGGEVNDPTAPFPSSNNVAAPQSKRVAPVRPHQLPSARDRYGPQEGHAIKAARLIASTVDVLDRPVGRLGPRGRRILGWFALATFGTAIIAYVLTCL